MGAYNHPITWWIGIFQLQMQMGLWGFEYRSAANIKGNTVWQLTAPIRSEIAQGIEGQSMPIMSALIRYNMKHRKADMLGRFLGGKFTNYAITGGRLGNKALSKKTKYSRDAINFFISSYGATIKAAVAGEANLQTIIQSILTGTPSLEPYGVFLNTDEKFSKEEQEIQLALKIALTELADFAHLSPAPASFEEFCTKEENANLRGLYQ